MADVEEEVGKKARSRRPIRRLLVANRGEIARRIFRTAHAMGIETVAVYADSDARAPFVAEADRAVALRGRSPAESYLDIERILAACECSGADAVHPGYGFLAENAAFARAVQSAGRLWVGPSPAVIEIMGDKLAAKQAMSAAGVPTLPAVEVGAEVDVAEVAREIGYPVLVKSAHGGGGRGMRVVAEPADLEESLSSAGREALGAFGSDTVFLERWLPAARHVEVQVLGDRHGNVVHLFERECSIQRRHQKIIEEAPSPAVDEALRARLGAAALVAARALGYVSAGTVEFLLDGEAFWFLEVNTRLQVEHPVTECITGLDLVREQLRVAEGADLDIAQGDLAMAGHAIEARIYAEDPARDFLPAPGRVEIWEAPSGVRVDAGVESGTEVPGEFDPMIAKIVAHAPTREEAAARLSRALVRTRVQGITTNRDLLVSVLRSPAFVAAETATDFLERHDVAAACVPDPEALVRGGIAALLFGQARRRDRARRLGFLASGWRNSHMPPERAELVAGGRRFAFEYRRARDGHFDVWLDGSPRLVWVFDHDRYGIDLDIDGLRAHYRVTEGREGWYVHGPGGDLELEEPPRFPLPGSTDPAGALAAPMPGKVLAVEVAEGDRVEAGQLLVVLEAMKMEHRIEAPAAGRVAALNVEVGEQVDNGRMLVVLDEAEV